MRSMQAPAAESARLAPADFAAFLKAKILNSMYPLFYSQNRLLNGREAAV